MLIQILTVDEIRQVLRFLYGEHSDSGQLNLSIFRLACCCGMRRKEISLLDLNHCRFSGPRPTLIIHKRITKGRLAQRRTRHIPMWWDKGTLHDLRMWRDYRLNMTNGDDTQPFVCSLRKDYLGKRLTKAKVAGHWDRVIARVLGRERARQLSIHAGRHSYISHAIDAGRSLPEVRDAAGHSSIEMTNRYIHMVERPDVRDIFG